MEKNSLSLNFKKVSDIKNFIIENESGIYDGKNIDGEQTRIFLEKGKGMDVKVLQKNNWWRVIEYNEEGEIVGETYEKNK